MDDKELFEQAMTDESVQDETEQQAGEAEAGQATEQVADDGQRERDEHGRFVAQQKQPDANAKQDEAIVPSWRLREQRERAEAAERQFQDAQSQFQRQIAELQARLPKAEQQQAPDIFENPGQFVEHATRQHLDPVRNEIGQLREYYSQRDAIREHGAEKVQAAYKAIEQGLSSRDPEAWATYQRAMQSMDPYGQIVQWHQQREVYSQIGNDPNAWFERELEKRMSEDPQFAAKQLQRIQQTTQQSSAAKQAPNRVALPPSLSRMSSAQVATDDGDLTDASLFANAMR